MDPMDETARSTLAGVGRDGRERGARHRDDTTHSTLSSGVAGTAGRNPLNLNDG